MVVFNAAVHGAQQGHTVLDARVSDGTVLVLLLAVMVCGFALRVIGPRFSATQRFVRPGLISLMVAAVVLLVPIVGGFVLHGYQLALAAMIVFLAGLLSMPTRSNRATWREIGSGSGRQIVAQPRKPRYPLP